jgi:nicotinate dehydrogenase subunit B
LLQSQESALRLFSVPAMGSGGMHPLDLAMRPPMRPAVPCRAGPSAGLRGWAAGMGDSRELVLRVDAQPSQALEAGTTVQAHAGNASLRPELLSDTPGPCAPAWRAC